METRTLASIPAKMPKPVETVEREWGGEEGFEGVCRVVWEGGGEVDDVGAGEGDTDDGEGEVRDGEAVEYCKGGRG